MLKRKLILRTYKWDFVAGKTPYFISWQFCYSYEYSLTHYITGHATLFPVIVTTVRGPSSMTVVDIA